MDREWRGDRISPNFTCRSLLALDPFLLWPRALSLCSLRSQAHCYKDGKMSFLHHFYTILRAGLMLCLNTFCVQMFYWITNWHDISKTYSGKLEKKHQSFKGNIWSFWTPVALWSSFSLVGPCFVCSCVCAKECTCMCMQVRKYTFLHAVLQYSIDPQVVGTRHKHQQRRRPLASKHVRVSNF